MTREEAIAWFENWLLDYYDIDDIPRGLTAELAGIALAAIRQQERFGEANKSLTIDELSERNAPVFLPIKDFPNGGYWCLCENGYIIPPSGHGFMAKERPNWVFYSQKPEEGTV